MQIKGATFFLVILVVLVVTSCAIYFLFKKEIDSMPEAWHLNIEQYCYGNARYPDYPYNSTPKCPPVLCKPYNNNCDAMRQLHPYWDCEEFCIPIFDSEGTAPVYF